jgi:hypothetical protein
MVLFFFCVATVSAGVSEPVEPKMKSLAFSLGYSHMRMLDAQVSPLIYKSHLIPIQIDYSSKKNDKNFKI